jgi:hypothetical protein
MDLLRSRMRRRIINPVVVHLLLQHVLVDVDLVHGLLFDMRFMLCNCRHGGFGQDLATVYGQIKVASNLTWPVLAYPVTVVDRNGFVWAYGGFDDVRAVLPAVLWRFNMRTGVNTWCNRLHCLQTAYVAFRS